MSIPTTRLRLRPYTEQDFGYLYTLNSNPEAMKFIRVPDTDESQTRERIMAMLEYRDRHPGHGVFLIERCSDGVVVGNMVIRHAELKEDGAIEVGYVIDPAHWGNGYATEGLQILQEYAHQQLGYSKLTAFTDAENVASGKVLKKCGFEIKGTTYIYGADLLHWERIGF